MKTNDKVKLIRTLVAEHYGVTEGDILSIQRTEPIVTARQVAMYFAVQLLHLSDKECSYEFQRERYSTAQSCKAVASRCLNRKFSADIASLRITVADALLDKAIA